MEIKTKRGFRTISATVPSYSDGERDTHELRMVVTSNMKKFIKSVVILKRMTTITTEDGVGRQGRLMYQELPREYWNHRTDFIVFLLASVINFDTCFRVPIMLLKSGTFTSFVVYELIIAIVIYPIMV